MILLACGGSAGHVYPALEVAKILPDCIIGGVAGDIAERLTARTPFTFLSACTIPIGRVLGDVMARGGVSLARAILISHGITKVVNFGHLAGLPWVLAARGLGLPVVEFVLDAIPNPVQAPHLEFADLVLQGFDVAANYVGVPIRAPNMPESNALLERLNFDLSKKTVLVNLGQEWLDMHMAKLLPKNINVIHASDSMRLEALTRPRAGYQVSTWPNLVDCLPFVDLVITHGGASTLHEAASQGVPTLIVPRGYYWGSEVANAAYFVARGYGIATEPVGVLAGIADLLPVALELSKFVPAVGFFGATPRATEAIINYPRLTAKAV